MRQKPALSEKASRSQPPWRTALAPPLALQVTPLWPPPPKLLQPVSKPHRQVASSVDETTTCIKDVKFSFSIFLSDSNKPAAKTEDLVLSVLIGLFSDSFAMCKVCSSVRKHWRNTPDTKIKCAAGSLWQRRCAAVRPGESAAVQGLPEGAAAAVQRAEGAGEEAPEENRRAPARVQQQVQEDGQAMQQEQVDA